MDASLRKSAFFRSLTVFVVLLFLGILDGTGAKPGGLPVGMAKSDVLLPRLVADGQFVYGHNMAGFDLEAYLQKQAPHLASHYYDLNAASLGQSISPKVILTMIEMRSGIVTNKNASAKQVEDPFLRSETGLVNQLIATSNTMTDRFYQHYYNITPLGIKDRPSLSLRSKDGGPVNVDPGINAGSYAVAAGLAEMLSVDEFLEAVDNSNKHGFYQTYQRLFPGENPLDESNKLPEINAKAPVALPSLQLPWPSSEAWKFNSVHTPNGSSSTLASIDFSRNFPAPGSNMSGDWVRPAAAGKAKATGPSSNPYCQVAVWHTSDGATRTTYFHLKNAQVTNNQDVTVNTNLANPASTYKEAITDCWSGTWTNPHLHFTLVYQGVYWPLNGVQLSGWTIHSGQAAYDCNTWFERNGVRKNNWCNGSGGDSVSAGGSTAPAAPSNLRATALSPTVVRLDWNDNSNNETSFEVYDGSTRIASVSANITYYTVGGVAPNSYHCYHLFARNGSGNSPWTDWACITTPVGGSNVNLAQGKASWATSSDPNLPPRYGNDGNTGTRWSSGNVSGAQWFKVDLGSVQSFNRFVVRWEWAYASTYWVAFCDNNCTSNDNSNWYGWQRTLSSRQDDVFDFGTQTHRYVGVYMVGMAPGLGNYSFWEFEVYNRVGANGLGKLQQDLKGLEPMKQVEPIQLPDQIASPQP